MSESDTRNLQGGVLCFLQDCPPRGGGYHVAYSTHRGAASRRHQYSGTGEGLMPHTTAGGGRDVLGETRG